MLCFNQSLITAQCPAHTINNWRSVPHYLLSLSRDSTIALRFAMLRNWYHCLYWWNQSQEDNGRGSFIDDVLPANNIIAWQNHFQSQVICLSFAMPIWTFISCISQLVKNGQKYGQYPNIWPKMEFSICKFWFTDKDTYPPFVKSSKLANFRQNPHFHGQFQNINFISQVESFTNFLWIF